MRQQLVCVNCGIEIRWQPTIVGDKVFCCSGCAQGGPCNCDYDNLPHPGDASAMVLCAAHSKQGHKSL